MRRLILPLVVLLLIGAAPAAASESRTWHGRITGATFTCRGADAVGPADVSGVWNLSMTGTSVVLRISVFYDGKHHMSFGAPDGVVVAEDPLTIDYWGGTATASLDGDAFTWAVADLGYACPADSSYDGLIYHGVVSP